MNIFESIEKGNLSKVKKLIDNGVDINVRNIYDNTPLHIACSNGYLEIVKYLENHIKYKHRISVLNKLK